MLSSYPAACACVGCGWAGNLIPSLAPGGQGAEVGALQRAWFRCPRCGTEWEVRIRNDRVTVVPAPPGGPTE